MEAIIAKTKPQIIDDILETHDHELLLNTLADMLYNDEDFVEELRMKLDEVSEKNLVYYHKHYRGDLHEHDDD